LGNGFDFGAFLGHNYAVMKQLLLLTCLVSALLSAACGGPRYGRYEEADRPATITQSLFDSKDRTISEADIQRILDGKIVPPDTLRVAVYKFSGRITRRYSERHYPWADEDRLKIEQRILDTLITALRQSKRVQKVIVMPVLVTGYQPNIQQLREAAVRLQADMALIFTLESDLYQQYRAFKKDDVKAYATCESVLMDIRTGIIPHADVVTREAYGEKTAADLTLDDMRRRVQNSAVGAAMAETGKHVAQYLGN
jgi:hypothetical protein